MGSTAVSGTDPLAAGRVALRSAAWDEARAQFEEAVDAGDGPEAWEGLGRAAWWQGDQEATLAARERAYRAYREAGTCAGRPGWRCGSHRITSTSAARRGRLRVAAARASAPPRSRAMRRVGLHHAARRGHRPAGEVRSASAERLAREALELARGIEDVGVEVVALALIGCALVACGAVDEGVQSLDECAALAVGEEFAETAAPGWALCHTVSACADVGDFGRAAQWCRALHSWSAVWQARHFFGVCRTAYGEVLATSGDWPSAEQELLSALEDLRTTRPPWRRRRPFGSAGCACGRASWPRPAPSLRRRYRCRRRSSPSASWISRPATRRRRRTQQTGSCGAWETRASSTVSRRSSSSRALAPPRATGRARARRPPNWSVKRLVAGQEGGVTLFHHHGRPVAPPADVRLEPFPVASPGLVDVQLLVVEHVEGHRGGTGPTQQLQGDEQLPVVDADLGDASVDALAILRLGQGSQHVEGLRLYPALDGAVAQRSVPLERSGHGHTVPPRRSQPRARERRGNRPVIAGRSIQLKVIAPSAMDEIVTTVADPSRLESESSTNHPVREARIMIG